MLFFEQNMTKKNSKRVFLNAQIFLLVRGG
jgi:hypothetical protein